VSRTLGIFLFAPGEMTGFLFPLITVSEGRVDDAPFPETEVGRVDREKL
jgi:hypothetical protein